MTEVHKKTLVADGLTPVVAYAALRGKLPGGSFLLESVEGGERWGRYSILGYRPKAAVTVWGEADRDPFSELARLIPSRADEASEPAERFATAHVGLLAYDLVHYAYKVPKWPSDAEGPLARLLGECTVVVFDHLAQTATIASTEEAHVREAEAHLATATILRPIAPPDPRALPEDLTVSVSDAEFSAVVERCREYIRAGDAFQIVPSRTFSVPAEDTDPFEVYRSMRALSPAPYMYFLDFPAEGRAPALAIAGASPETLVKVDAGQVYVRPIAGTRKRGKTPEEDQALADEMMADPKEIAEHVMLIDLARNDIGRVSKPGTVRVPARLFVERYSHVMHITSEVQGEVRDDQTPWDVLRATFPAGTLSGAPKVRAMQIIRELELRPRGSYGGAIGYVTGGRNLDLAIAIRSVALKNGRFEVTAGAGIVADSDPELECKETRNKARAALSAIHAARQRKRGA
jgi:anthranilate synthase component 1